MEEIIIAALKFYIQHLRLDIRHLDECGEDTGRVDLGFYIVESMKVEAWTNVLFLSGYQKFPERIRLHIKRKD